MSEAKIRQQTLAIFDNNGLRWIEQDGGYSLRFASARVLVGFTPLGEQTMIALRAPVLHDVPLNDEANAALRALNDLNRGTHFGKWTLYEDERLIVVEYDLLGDHLQENELMTALTALARLADQQDDLLQRQLGGQRSFEQP